MSERITVRSLAGTQVEATNGKSRVVLDLPAEDGGPADGLGPHETLLSALGGCTAMTVAAYARRKSWPLQGTEIALTREKPAVGAGDAPTRIVVAIRLMGPLDDAQRARLLEIAGKCPVNRTLSGRIEIVETLA